MIVSCRSCQTRFRIADEKVKDRGVKVRCSRCGEVFVVRRDDEPLPGAGDVPWGSPGPGGAPTPLPTGDEQSVHDQITRVADVPAGILGLSAQTDLTPSVKGHAAPRAPPPPPPYKPPAVDPFAALDPFGETQGPAAVPISAVVAASDPFAGLELDGPQRPGPPPLPPPPRASPTSPSPIVGTSSPRPLAPPPGPPPPAFGSDVETSPRPFGTSPGDDDPFAGLDTAAPPVPPAAPDPFGLADFASDAAGGPLDLDLQPAAPAQPKPPPPPDGGDDFGFELPTTTAAHRAKPVARLSSPEARLPTPARPVRRAGGLSTALSVLAGVVLLVGLLLALVASRGGGLSPATLRLDSIFAALGLDVSRAAGSGGELVPREVVTGLYPTAAGKHVLFVRGRIESLAAKESGPAVRVSAELLADGDRVIGRAEGWAGPTPSLEQIHSLRSEADWAELTRALGLNAVPVAPQASAPFLVVFSDPPPRLERARVRLSAVASARPEAPPPPAPVPTAVVPPPPVVPPAAPPRRAVPTARRPPAPPQPPAEAPRAAAEPEPR